MVKQPYAKRAVLLLLSFLIPCVIIGVAISGMHITPFGNNTLIISDAHGLYVNFIAYASRMFRGIEGITYSFEKGLGGNMMGSLGWFLLNPTFALFSLFNTVDYPMAFSFLSTLNLSLCGLTMHIFLSKVFGYRQSNLIFSTSYALMGFNVANVFQANFWVGPIMLPIVILGVWRVLQGKNIVTYSISFAFMLVMNFYFGFIVGVASVFMFVSLLALKWHHLPSRKQCVARFAAATILAALISAVIWLPAVLSLRGGRLSQTGITDYSFRENMPFLDMLSKLFTGANSTSQLADGLPNIFVGIFPLALAILFFVDPRNDKRTKCIVGALVLFYLISFYLVAIDMLMHGGTVTNWFNHRDSFVLSFLLIVIATAEWNTALSISSHDVVRTLVILLIGALMVFSKSYEFVMGGEVLLDFILLAIICFMVHLHKADPIKNPKKVLTTIILIIVSINLLLNYVISTENILEWGIKESEYQEAVSDSGALAEGVIAGDSSFYRMEINKQRSGTLGNDPMLYGYNGVGHGGSDERNFVRSGLNQLGIHWYDMRNYYNEGVPAATDSLLGIKYLIAKESIEEEKGYDRISDLSGSNIFFNPNALPIAVVCNSSIVDTTSNADNVFANLNSIYTDIVGERTDVFTEETEVKFVSHSLAESVEVSSADARQTLMDHDSKESVSDSLSETDNSKESSSSSTLTGTFREMPTDISCVEFSFVARQDGPVYTYNRSGLNEQGSSLPVLNYEGYYHRGETVVGYLPVFAEYVSRDVLNDVGGKFRVAYANQETLTAACQTILARPSSIEKESDSYLRGELITAENQLLLLTIPFDEGWTCYIDGQQAEIVKTLDLFMSVYVEPGEHTYEMRYIPVGLVPGGILSAVGIVLLVVFVVFEHLRHH